MAQISENLLVSEGCDLTIKIWKISNDEKFIMELLTTYQEESIAYGLIKLDEGVLASVVGEKFIEILYLKIEEGVLHDRKKIGLFDKPLFNLLKLEN